MKTLSKLFLSGLLAVVPITLTIYLLYWLGSSAEEMGGAMLKLLLPEGYYYKGMGLASGIALILAVGILLKAWIFRTLFQWGEALVAKVPMVRSVYNSIRDLMQFVSKSEGSPQGQVVSVDIEGQGMSVIGFLTQENVNQLHPSLPEGHAAVYIPMSYMIGGWTVIVPQERVTPIDMPINTAMRFAITAGMIGDNTVSPRR